MKLLSSVLLALFMVLLFGASQSRAQTTAAEANESNWLPNGKILTAPARAIGAPFRVFGKWAKHIPAEPADSGNAADETGIVAFEQAQTQSTPLGFVSILNTNVGYAFSSHFTADVGLPVFFVRSPFSLTNNKDWRWTTWLLGNPYLDLRYSTKRFGPSITTILTGTIPVSTTDRVFTNGRPGVDWFNHIEKSYKGVTPFLNLGAANGTVDRFIMPRPYSAARPYQTLGFISDFEGGASYKFRKAYSIGGSAYALVPGGPQKMYSRLVSPDFALGGNGDHNRYFNTVFLTEGPSRIARDNGFSAWVEITRIPHTNLQIGYTRSVHYAYDALTVVITFDGRFLFKEPSN